jgi:hypothetical protein
VALFKKRLRPSSEDTRRIRELIDNLNSLHHRLRELANRQLAAVGELAEPSLRQAFEPGRGSLELRRRIEVLLAAALRQASPAAVCRLRATQVLGHIGTTEARGYCGCWQGAAARARETRAARTMLNRLDHLTNSK